MPPTLTEFTIEDPQADKAEIHFTLSGHEGQEATVRLSYRVADGGPRRLKKLSGFGADLTHLTPQAYVLTWDYRSEDCIRDDGGFTPGVVLTAEVVSTDSEPRELTVGVGNDPPVISDVCLPVNMSGNVVVPFDISDSSGDLISVSADFLMVNASSDCDGTTWKPATPAVDIRDIPVSPEGTRLSFIWDTTNEDDLQGLRRKVCLRITPRDQYVDGDPRSTTAAFIVDNNMEPNVHALGERFNANPDRRRGVPIPWELTDESPGVSLVCQWSTDERFPQLPSDIPAVLSDPVKRRELRVCSPLTIDVRGPVQALAPDAVRFPKLSSEASWLRPYGLRGRSFELLRREQVPRPLDAPTAGWDLDRPVGVLPVGRGVAAVVLDGDGGGGWRLRILDLASGAVLEDLARSSSGVPSALAAEPEGTFLVASVLTSGLWRLERVVPGAGVELLLNAPPETLGPVRSIAPLGPTASVVTAEDSLVLVRYEIQGEALRDTSLPRFAWEADPTSLGDGTRPLAVPVLRGLSTPWGVVTDPALPSHVYLTERTQDVGHVSPPPRVTEGPHGSLLARPSRSPNPVGRLLSVDLGTRSLRSVSLLEALPRPTSMARDPRTGHLLIMVDHDPHDGNQELVEVVTAGLKRSVTTIAQGFATPVAGIAAGPGGLLLLAVPERDDLAVGGGVEQESLIVDVGEPGDPILYLSPPLRPFLPGRIANIPFTGGHVDLTGPDRSTLRGSFLWDTASDLDAPTEVFVKVTSMDEEELGSSDQTAVGRALAGLFPSPRHSEVPLQWADTECQLFQDCNARDLAVADLNDDGLLDVVVGTQHCDILVYYQVSPGVLSPCPSLVLDAPNLRAVAAGDLDQDGKVDLIAACERDDSLSIYFQEEGPTPFPSSMELDHGTKMDNPVSIALGDFDRDGNLDIVSANSSSSNLTLFSQESTRLFVPRTIDLCASSAQLKPVCQDDPCDDFEPVDVSVSDVDRDGHPDLLVVFESSCLLGGDGVAVLFQKPDQTGRFTRPSVIHERNLKSALATDIQQDGLPDLVLTTSRQSGPYLFYRQVAPRQFVPEAQGCQGGLDLRISGVVDVDGDGDRDLVAANPSGRGIPVYQREAGRYRCDATPVGLDEVEGAVAIAVLDMDGDGALDLVSANDDSQNLTLFQLGPTPPPESVPTSLGEGTVEHPCSLKSADLDGDGDLDVAVANENHLSVLFQRFHRSFAPPETVHSGQGTFNPRSVEAADLDQDGDLDLVTANGGADTLTVFRQDGEGFRLCSDGTLSGVHLPQEVVATDLDLDGALDLVSANAGSANANLALFLQNADTTFRVRYLDDPDGRGLRSVAASDLDNDGDVDLATANFGTIRVFLQDQPGFEGETTYESVPLADVRRIGIVDIDRDGLTDLIGSATEGVSILYQGEGPVLYPSTNRVFLPTLGVPYEVASIDLDMSGELDLVVATDTRPGLLAQTRRRCFAPITSLPLLGPRPLMAVDLDLDGDRDLATCSPVEILVLWGGD